MNLHPLFVHFPIALLLVYSFFELLRFKKLMAQPYWFYVKGLFLMLGGLGALAATFTGDMARHAVRDGDFTPAVTNFNQVVSAHENFAHLSVVIFGLLAAGYFFLWFERAGFASVAQKLGLSGLWKILVGYGHIFVETPLVIFMALAGLVCITLTGGLGGIMVYGPSADPFFGMVYKILFPGN